MSQSVEYSQEEKKMELDNGNDKVTNLISPQDIANNVESLSNDLKYLCGTGVSCELLQHLEKSNVTTFEEILLIKPNNMSNPSQIYELQQSIANQDKTVHIRGCLLFERKKTKYFSTGCNSLDRLINNENNPGIASKSITSFIGSSSSSKTLLLFQICSVCVLNGGHVIFIDCHNQFDPQRCYDLLQSIGHKLFPFHPNQKSELFESCMHRIHIFTITSFEELSDLINDTDGPLYKLLHSYSIDMIMIDNIGLCSYLHELNQTFYCHGEIQKFGKTLKCLAIKYNLSVITTSLAISSSFENEYWINSSRSSVYKNWYQLIDTEIALILTTRFGAIRPMLTKSHSKNIFNNKHDNDVILSIDQHIIEQS